MVEYYLKLINAYRQPQQILLLSSTHATCSVYYWPSSDD